MIKVTIKGVGVEFDYMRPLCG